MKRLLKCIICAVLILSLTACTAIEYADSPEETTPANHETQIIITTDGSETDDYDKYNLTEPALTAQDFSFEAEIEGNCDATTRTSLGGYQGDGYIQLSGNFYTTVTVTVPTAQHYDVTLFICSAACKVALITGGENEIDSPDGDYKTVDGTEIGAYYIDESVSFAPYTIKGVYLDAGENKLTFQSLSGIAYIDRFSVVSGKTADDNFYVTNTSPVDKEASTGTVRIMSYLHDIYGKRVLTGQTVTPNTDAELYAIYNETGRFPALRASDLAVYTARCPYSGSENSDIELAAAWAEKGGLVSYCWTWYAPSDSKTGYLDASTDFDFSKVTTSADVSGVSLDTIKALWGDGTISEETYLLMQDLDEMAAILGQLQEKNVTVLFRPLMEAGNGWYWWGTDAVRYKWLWQTMVKRFNGYHGLHNLIWVWNGENAEFYPGGDYVDIVGEDVYGGLLGSASVRFTDTSRYLANGKSLALTECSSVPDPDAMYRDNAKWLWFSVWKGDYIIDENGAFSDAYTTKERLEYAYNHQLFLTLDELPRLSEYSSPTA